MKRQSILAKALDWVAAAQGITMDAYMAKHRHEMVIDGMKNYFTAVIESFFGSLQRELLDTQTWQTRTELANAIFDWIETWYNPKRRHSYCQMLSPIDYETAKAA